MRPPRLAFGAEPPGGSFSGEGPLTTLAYCTCSIREMAPFVKRISRVIGLAFLISRPRPRREAEAPAKSLRLFTAVAHTAPVRQHKCVRSPRATQQSAHIEGSSSGPR